MDSAFDEFLQKHGKIYSAEERAARQKVFKENLNKLAALNAHHSGKATFKPSLYMDMTKEEVMRFRGGKAKGSSKSRRTAEHWKYVSEHVSSGVVLPSDFDWRSKDGVIGRVKDQAMCGSCWAYGAIGPVESALVVTRNAKPILLPEQYIVDCAWTNNTGASGQNSGCFGGDSDIGILEIVRKFQGRIPTAAAYGSYLSTNGYCKDISKMEIGAIVSGWTDIKKNDIDGFKDALVRVGAISISIMVPEAMLYFDSGVLDDASCTCDEKQIDHAVEAVGYGVDNGKAYWTVRNSWSTYWGDEGYIRIVQGARDCCVATEAGYISLAPKSDSIVV